MSDDIADRFGATVDLVQPPTESAGFFGVWRADAVEQDRFLSTVLKAVGGREYIAFSSASGFALVWTTFDRARRLEGQPSVSLVGGVEVDAEQLFEALGDQP